jgi:pimeloyl-ACP methyl ester carboxylesterase
VGHPFVVTLVHGTWGWRSPFLRHDSLMQNRLRLELGPDTRFVQFRWSGLNSVIARSRAASRLSEELATTISQYPSASHLVLAHSHGGNVALKALEMNPKLEEQICGVGCLSTPFLIARLRDHGVSPERISIVLSIIVVLIWLYYLWFSFLIPPNFGLLLIAYPVLITIVSSVIVFALAAFAVHAWREFAKATLIRMKCRVSSTLNLLILRTSLDEAGAALASMQMFQMVIDRILHVMNDFLNFFDGYESRTIVVPRLEKYPAILGHPLIVLWLFLMLFGILIRSLIYLIALPAYLFLIPLVTPFGFELAIASYWLEVGTETTPPGAWLVRQLDAKGIGTQLTHTGVHSRDDAVEAIVRWINDSRGRPSDPIL